MKRDLIRLTQKTYDVAIIGGGIYGACIAWDATLRGLAVVLVEQGDFGGATSANSQKIIHGGLRYLQHGAFRRMRESIRERHTLMHIAPHLVHPLQFLIPTYGYGLRSKAVLAIAMLLNDLISCDRNRHGDPQKYLPRGRVISKKACLQLVPGLEEPRLTGGAVWFDGQVQHAERLTLTFLLSAAEQGADVANYAQVVDFLRQKDCIRGVKIRDELTHNCFEISSRLVVNTSGPWINHILSFLNQESLEHVHFVRAIVLVTRQLLSTTSFGIYGKSNYKDQDVILDKGSRLFFITPWKDTSLIGTFHTKENLNPNRQRMSQEEIHHLLQEINDIYPAASLKREDIYHVYQGLLPINGQDSNRGDVQIAKQYRIIDHAEKDHLEGLISVTGVKLTTARDVAEKVVNLIMKKLRCSPVTCRTAGTPLAGGHIERFDDYLKKAIAHKPAEFDSEVITHLVYHYGTYYLKILDHIANRPELGQRISPDLSVIKAEIVYAVQEEMAIRLSDVICRRTALAYKGLPDEACLLTCAHYMAEEFGWNATKIEQEIDMVRKSYSNMTEKFL